MAIRAIHNWLKVLEDIDPERSSEAARRILGDLTHYNSGRAYETEDIQTLANALDAWARKRKGWNR